MRGNLNYQTFGLQSNFLRSRKKFPFSIFTFHFSLFLLSFALLLVAPVYGQEVEPEEIAPPPVKTLSKAEKTSLEAEPDLKKRVKLSIELMEARLKKAEELNAQEFYNEMFNELGGFHALMNEALGFLNRNGGRNGKALDHFKRFEMALRAFMPRIEVIRRDLPTSYEYYVRGLLKNVRETRAKAIEPLYSNTVLPGDGN